jgi:hypothetical protein
MKQVFYILSLLITFQTVRAQDSLFKGATDYTQAIVDRDFDKVITKTLPNIVEMGGGKELMVQDLHSERQQVVDNGLDYISAKIGEPGKVFESNGDQQLIFPVTYKVVSNLNELNVNAKLLAVSKDKGKSWYFLDIEKYDRESLKSFYSNLSDDIKF